MEPIGQPKSFISSLFDDIFKDIEEEDEMNAPPNVKIFKSHTPLLPFSPSFMHPPHVVSFSEFMKNPIKTGPHPKFADKKDDKKKDEPKKDDKTKKEDKDKKDDKNSADPKNKKDDDWGTKKDEKNGEKIKTTKLG